VRRIPLRWGGTGSAVGDRLGRDVLGSPARGGFLKVEASISSGPGAGLMNAVFVRPKSNSSIERLIRESRTRMPVLCPRGTQNTEREDEHRS